VSGPDGLVITIDGVVGAGKSSTARAVAARLGYRHLDTGAMYRAVTLAAQRAGIAPVAGPELDRLLGSLRIVLEPLHRGGAVRLDDEDVSEAIRQPQISRGVGGFADLASVRRALVEQQQRLGARGGVVADGRDTGTVVFPAADLKIRMVAALAARARRRHRELVEKGVCLSLEQVAADIGQRDAEDARRDYGSSALPADLVELDTSDMTLDEQVDRIVSLARRHGA